MYSHCFRFLLLGRQHSAIFRRVNALELCQCADVTQMVRAEGAASCFAEAAAKTRLSSLSDRRQPEV